MCKGGGGSAYVYVRIYYRQGICIRADIYYGQCICIRADILQAYVYVRIYIFNAPEAGSAYMYTCKDITGICIRAKIYIYYGLSFTT